MSTVQLPRGTYQNTTQQVDADMRTHALITPASAAAIAAWWQSPVRVGRVLASFAGGYRVDVEDILDDIGASALELDPLDFDERAYLEALREWVIRTAEPAWVEPPWPLTIEPESPLVRRCAHCGTTIIPDGLGAWVDETDGDGCDNPTNAHQPVNTNDD